ncbi:ATP-binding protein [Alkaliphilus serpentinus]|uniref:ATP-binding protein n=1 Tax=Alkaliphilus serpentinus TaxID=1482731 RepID=A0A833HM69_9FIRM|nr:ATP-binding protein [Alkaliphilus serpentinus]KAB3527190.1 ATP-binding protein [Alkaliphilus serpentinus]
MLKDNRIRVIIGHYGSGKTEFAINYAIELAKEKDKIALADLDVVNPYFRSREMQQLLEEKGIKVISSYVTGSGSDLPSVTADVLGPLQDKECNVILDVGGDAMGARTLGRYKAYFQKGEYDMFCVINGNRPGTQDLNGILHHIATIEATSRARITGLINNTHLLRHTTINEVLKGQELTQQASEKLNIPIKYVSVMESLVADLPKDLEGEIIPIRMIMREDWM